MDTHNTAGSMHWWFSIGLDMWILILPFPLPCFTFAVYLKPKV